MSSKSIVHLLLLFLLFVSCLPAPNLLLVETEGGEEADEDGGADDGKADEDGGADYNCDHDPKCVRCTACALNSKDGYPFEECCEKYPGCRNYAIGC